MNVIFTVGSTPLQISALLGLDPTRAYSQTLFVQMLPGASAGVGYVYKDVQSGKTPDSGAPAAGSGDLAAELAAATAAAPGGSYSYQPYVPGQRIDLTRAWVHGAHAGDTGVISVELAK